MWDVRKVSVQCVERKSKGSVYVFMIDEESNRNQIPLDSALNVIYKNNKLLIYNIYIYIYIEAVSLNIQVKLDKCFNQHSVTYITATIHPLDLKSTKFAVNSI